MAFPLLVVGAVVCLSQDEIETLHRLGAETPVRFRLALTLMLALLLP